MYDPDGTPIWNNLPPAPPPGAPRDPGATPGSEPFVVPFPGQHAHAAATPTASSTGGAIAVTSAAVPD